MLLGQRVTDFDIATDARPEEVQKLFRRVIPTGIKHGTVTVLFQGTHFEVTTFRVEEEYLDGRRPRKVRFIPSIEEDLKRRDFTINAVAYDLQRERLLDPHAGRADLDRRLIRAIGDPDERFREDGLRPVRACRFAAQLEFRIQEETLAAIGRALPTVRQVSVERVREELERLLKARMPSIGFRLMLDAGLLAVFLPELARCRGVEQRERHCFDVFEHSLYTCDAAARENLPVRLAALFHDLGKPDTLTRDDQGAIRFHGHELVSARLAEEVTRRLKFPNRVIQKVSHLVRHHMFNFQEEWSDAAIRRFIVRVGEEEIPDLLALRRADQIGQCRRWEVSANLIEFERRILQVLEGEKALGLKDLAVDGGDLMEHLTLEPGPRIGVILGFLLETVLEDPQLNRRELLLEIARRFYEERLRAS
jgi:poly(A) polymerase/tRNA nucleotidyltransferase (CCA-adding enzyme)